MSTSTKRCYYETLEVERDADESKLKSSFRKLAMKFHPDRNPGDDTSEVKFKEINEAYEVLKDKDKRAAYDRFGHAAFEQGGPGGGAGFGALERMRGGREQLLHHCLSLRGDDGPHVGGHRDDDIVAPLGGELDEVCLHEAWQHRSAQVLTRVVD
jgi:DnaJ-class molecular chaperone